MKKYKDMMIGDIIKIECGEAICIGEIVEIERTVKNFVLIKTTNSICNKVVNHKINGYKCFLEEDNKVLPLTKEERLMVMKYKLCGVTNGEN